MFVGNHCIAHWSRTNQTIALSYGEAELNASLKGATELLSIKGVFDEMQKPVKIELEGDSTACKGILHRSGVGRQKHFEVKQLWVQNHVQSGAATFAKIPRSVNRADLLTKFFGNDAEQHFHALNLTFPEEGVRQCRRL